MNDIKNPGSIHIIFFLEWGRYLIKTAKKLLANRQEQEQQTYDT